MTENSYEIPKMKSYENQKIRELSTKSKDVIT